MKTSRSTSPRIQLLSTFAIASLALLGLSACSDDDSEPPTVVPSPSQTSSVSTSPSPSSSPSSSSSAAADSPNDALVQAGKTALTEVPESTLISIETESNGSWEVQVVTKDGTEHEMDVSEDGSEVIRGPFTEDEDGDDKAKHQERVNAASIDYEKAAEKLLAVVKGSHITELNLDTENGATVWEADLLDEKGEKHSVSIDAASGEVVQNHAGD